MNKRVYKTIKELDEAIKTNEERILELNKYIRLVKANHDVETLVNLEDIKREYKALNRRLRQSKKELMQTMTNYAEEIDKNTKNQVSLKPLTREILRSKYQVSDSFKGITLNSINDELPVRLSSRALSKLVKKVFPDVQERKCTNDIKYNLEGVD